jgi:hypothetical protein
MLPFQDRFFNYFDWNVSKLVGHAGVAIKKEEMIRQIIQNAQQGGTFICLCLFFVS